jgi:hypothetical protein
LRSVSLALFPCHQLHEFHYLKLSESVAEMKKAATLISLH